MCVRLLCSLFVLTVSNAHAAISLGQTRVIVTEHAKKAVIDVHNADRQPVLLQTWIDGGAEQNSRAAPSPDPSPFLIDPPVMRLDPGQTRAIQVLLIQAPDTLPTNRETLFWLNVLEVAGTAPVETDTPVDDPRLNISIRSRLKLFYRPQTLAQYTRGYQYTEADRLRFTLMRDGQDMWLSIVNPAPTYQSLASLTLRAAGTTRTLDAPMLAPFEHRRLRVSPSPATHWRLIFALMDDDGNILNQEQDLIVTSAP